MNHRSLKLFGLILYGVVCAEGCKPASYEVLNPKKTVANTQNVAGSPTTPGGTIDPPTARVEVLYNSQSVVTVDINVPTRISPSWDTLSPDFIGTDTCPNPGIVTAQYGVATEAQPSATRTQGSCTDLSVPYTFTHTGDYLITMLVTDKNGQTAYASMTLTVIDPNNPANDGGFTVAANPMVAGKGQTITFTGYCQLQEQFVITWNFGDGATGTGTQVTHAYQQDGADKVTATCTGTDGRTKTAAVTVVIVDNPPQQLPNQPATPDTPATFTQTSTSTSGQGNPSGGQNPTGGGQVTTVNPGGSSGGSSGGGSGGGSSCGCGGCSDTSYYW